MGDTNGPVDCLFVIALAAMLVWIATTDIRQCRIPNKLNLVFGLLGVGRALYHHPGLVTVAGELVGVAATLAAVVAVTRLAGRAEEQTTLGWGDIKFVVAASCWVGFSGSITTLLVALWLTCVGILLLRPWCPIGLRQTVPFAPMLAAALAAVLVAGSGMIF
jgi:leader peptidase (prepilin peptidase)/N-methyltransferase